MAHRTRRNVGEPDMTIIANGGRVYFTELKRKGGKPSPEQVACIAWMQKLGANARVIYSLSEFCEWVAIARIPTSEAASLKPSTE